jgi:flotillin
MLLTWVIPIAIALLFVSITLVCSVQYRKVGPNEVLIVSGRKCVYVDPSTGNDVRKNFSVHHGGGTFVVPLRERVDVMSVELMTLEIETPEFYTKLGVPIVVNGIAQIKVRSDDPFAIATAAEMFLSKTKAEMNEIAHQMMQGHLRAVISTLSFDEIHAKPEAFASSVQRLTAEDLDNMGIEVVSFTIREVSDPSGYLDAMGRPQLAEARKRALLGEAAADRDATMGKATAERDAAVTAALATQESKQAQLAAALAVANDEAERDMKLHALSSRVAEAKAESDLAYALQQAKTEQRVARETLALRDLTISAREKELVETVQKPVDAERYRTETLARAEQAKVRLLAEAEADAIRLRGLAQADVCRAQREAEAEGVRQAALAEAEGLQAKLLAEAEGMKQKAEAWKQYSTAALQEMLIDKLPEVAAAVAAPLQSIDRIVMINSGDDSGVQKITKGVTDVIAQLPAVVEAATGVDIGKLLRERVGAEPSQVHAAE